MGKRHRHGRPFAPTDQDQRRRGKIFAAPRERQRSPPIGRQIGTVQAIEARTIHACRPRDEALVIPDRGDSSTGQPIGNLTHRL